MVSVSGIGWDGHCVYQPSILSRAIEKGVEKIKLCQALLDVIDCCFPVDSGRGLPADNQSTTDCCTFKMLWKNSQRQRQRRIQKRRQRKRQRQRQRHCTERGCRQWVCIDCFFWRILQTWFSAWMTPLKRCPLNKTMLQNKTENALVQARGLPRLGIWLLGANPTKGSTPPKRLQVQVQEQVQIQGQGLLLAR